MKINNTFNTKFFLQNSAKTIFNLAFIGFMLCFNSCHKDESQNGLNVQSSNKKSPLQITAYKVLKVHASAAEFNDLDWNHTAISNVNGAPYLLRIRSLSNPAKELYYSKKNGVTHARWVQLKLNSSPSSGSFVVSSLNETNRRESVFEQGKMLSSKFIRMSIQNSSQPAAANSSAGGLAATVPVSAPSANGLKIRLQSTQRTDEEEGGGDDGGSFDGGDDGSGDDGNGDNGSGNDDGGGDGSSGSGGIYGSDGYANGGSGYTWIVAEQPAEYALLDNSDNSVTLYSLYFLMGNNPAYSYEYTTNPNAGVGGGSSGTVVTLITPGTVSGIDPRFIPGQKSGVPILNYQPNKALLGYDVSFAYVISGSSNTITVTNLASGLVGTVVGYSWSPLSSLATVSGSTITFTVTGNLTLNPTGSYPLTQSGVQVTGTYNTTNGAFTVSVN